MTKIQFFKDIADKFVRSELDVLRIEDVRVAFGESSDGDKLMFITVVFASEPDKLPVGRLTREMWSRLAEENEDAFPLFSFRTQEEDQLRNAA
jgi:hypothetical protein